MIWLCWASYSAMGKCSIYPLHCGSCPIKASFFIVLTKWRRPSLLVLQKCPIILPIEKVCYVTKYLQPENGTSSLCEVTLKGFLPIKDVIPSVFCYFPDLRFMFNIFLRSYLSENIWDSFDIRPFLWALVIKFISAVPQNYRPCTTSGLPEALFLIQTYVPSPPISLL